MADEKDNIIPQHITDALLKRRDEIICLLAEEGFKLREIQIILQYLTTSRINQIIISNRAKKIGDKGA